MFFDKENDRKWELAGTIVKILAIIIGGWYTWWTVDDYYKQEVKTSKLELYLEIVPKIGELNANLNKAQIDKSTFRYKFEKLYYGEAMLITDPAIVESFYKIKTEVGGPFRIDSLRTNLSTLSAEFRYVIGTVDE